MIFNVCVRECVCVCWSHANSRPRFSLSPSFKTCRLVSAGSLISKQTQTQTHTHTHTDTHSVYTTLVAGRCVQRDLRTEEMCVCVCMCVCMSVCVCVCVCVCV